MGKIVFDSLQTPLIEEFKKNSVLRKEFYFTGGTALSAYYLHHRLSEDLDFFSECPFSSDTVVAFMNYYSKKYRCKTTLRQPESLDILIFELDFGTKGKLKVDFNTIPISE